VPEAVLSFRVGQKGKVILMLADCHSYNEVRRKIACTDRYISGWKLRFQLERLAGLDSRYRGAEYRRRTAQTEARILELTRCGPNDGSTHWSSYRFAKELGTSQSTISRVWRQFGLQPHRSRSFMTSDDPEFEEKAADIIGLYLKPPVHAAVFCVDAWPRRARFYRAKNLRSVVIAPPRRDLRRLGHSRN
jgi:hypothetical protein